MAEYLFKSAIEKVGLSDKFAVASAGIMADNGTPASMFAVQAIRDINPDIDKHMSRKVTQKLLNSVSAIFCLTEAHRTFLLSNYKGIEKKCFLLKEFLATEDRDIPDPFSGDLGEYERIRDDINATLDSILQFLLTDNRKTREKLKLSIGNDHGGYDLAMSLIRHLKGIKMDIFYYGAFSKDEPVDYPDYVKCVVDDVMQRKSCFGILICRSGTGMCIAANKFHGIRAANCWSTEVACRAREHNDANILCIGSDFVKADDAKDIVQTFLSTKFSGGRHAVRIKKVGRLENLL
jgi:ribose 5-phosphate isomerase B